MTSSNQETTTPSIQLMTKLQTEFKDPAIQRVIYDALVEAKSPLINDPEVIAMKRNHPDYIEAKAQLRKDERKKDQQKTAEQLHTANLEVIKNILAPTKLAISSHTLDTEVQGKKIYTHLSLYQNKFAEKFVIQFPNSMKLEEKIQSFDERMSKIKLDSCLATTDSNVKDRSIVSGNDDGNYNDKGVPDVTYVRNQGYNCTKERETEIRSIIDDLGTEYGLNLSESIQLFILKMGLGKYGGQSSGGEFCLVGNYGGFAIGPVNGNGNVPYIYFDDDVACFDFYLQKYAVPQLSN